IIRHDLSELVQICLKKVRTMHRGARLNKQVIRFKLSSKINSFLEVGLARCQLTRDAKVSAPGPTSARHAYLQLCPKILREEISAKLLQPPLKVFIDPMSDDVKEPPFAACLSYLSCDIAPPFCPDDKGIYVDNRDARMVICADLVHTARTCN